MSVLIIFSDPNRAEDNVDSCTELEEVFSSVDNFFSPMKILIEPLLERLMC